MKSPFSRIRTLSALPLPLGAAIALLSGCTPESPTSAGEALPGATKSYAVTGVVQRIEPDGRRAIIDHDAIPGYMMAMIMPFDLRDTNELADVYPGDQIRFRLLVTEEEAWIDQVSKTGVQMTVPSRFDSGSPAFPLELDLGDFAPECTLTNDQGNAFTLSELRGNAVALTFIFTRCPLPTYCPLMSRQFAQVSQEMRSRPSPENWRLLTISFDPEFDSPSILKNYAQLYRTNDTQWLFATTGREEVEQFGRQFGLFLIREEGTISHNLRTIVLTPSGRIQHVFRDNRWEAAELTAQLREAAAESLTSTPQTCRLRITGMACDACALTIQSGLRKLPGVVAATVDFTNQIGVVTYRSDQTMPQDLIRTIRALEYDAALANASAGVESRGAGAD